MSTKGGTKLIKKWFFLFVLAILVIFSLGISSSSAAGSKFIIINKSNNQLAYYENNQLTKVFKVGTGRSQSLTPEGRFKIVNKIKNRPYYKDGISGGDPRNPLGNRWLGINARGTWGTTYAIHGNNNPNSIGGYVSSGCVRMYDNEVEWLFNQVPVNTPVIITTSGKSFDSIAVSYGYKVTESSVPVTANGQNTESAVRQFQKARRLTVDGVVGPATRKALGGTTVTKPTSPSSPSKGSDLAKSGILKKGSKGASVKELQRILTAKGYNTKGLDGIFGQNTDKAVRQFQKARGLAVDGIVGPNTIKELR
jgi:peptidoglycan hydrolase-like protein with peptidoglycan-binding domain